MEFRNLFKPDWKFRADHIAAPESSRMKTEFSCSNKPDPNSSSAPVSEIVRTCPISKNFEAGSPFARILAISTAIASANDSDAVDFPEPFRPVQEMRQSASSNLLQTRFANIHERVGHPG